MTRHHPARHVAPHVEEPDELRLFVERGPVAGASGTARTVSPFPCLGCGHTVHEHRINGMHTITPGITVRLADYCYWERADPGWGYTAERCECRRYMPPAGCDGRMIMWPARRVVR